MQNQIIKPIIRALDASSARNNLKKVAAVALLGKLLSGRRRPAPNPALWAGAGILFGAAVALLVAPSTGRDLRSRLLGPLERAGGGIGKRIGQVVGEQVGAHPVATAKLAQQARAFVGPSHD